MEEENKNKAQEPMGGYKGKRLYVFKSLEEQEEFKLKEMAQLSPTEILMQLRKLINIAYGMHGYDPANLPKKHSIRIIQNGK